MSQLLEKAKSYKPKKRNERVFTQEELELFIALAKEEITLSQAQKALNYEHSGTIYVNIAKAFIQLCQRGIIEFKPFKNAKSINCKRCQREMIVLDSEERNFCSSECHLGYKVDLKKARTILHPMIWRMFKHIKK